jgi:hypothetical protein
MVTIDSNWENDLLGEHQVIAASHGLHVNIEVINAESPEFLAAPPMIYWGDPEGKLAGEPPIRILLHNAHYYPVVKKGSWPNRKEEMLLSADPAAYQQPTIIPTAIDISSPESDNIGSPAGSVSTIAMHDKSTSMTPIEAIPVEIIPVATSPNLKLLTAPPNVPSAKSPAAAYAANTDQLPTLQEFKLLKAARKSGQKDVLIAAGAGLLTFIVTTVITGVATFGIMRGFQKLTDGFRKKKEAATRKKLWINNADDELVTTARW